MRQLKAALLAGLMLSGCGIASPAPYASRQVAPVGAAYAPSLFGGYGLSVDKTLMPPLEVFKTLETETKAWVAEFKKANGLQYAYRSPVLHTMRVKMGSSKVAYFVTTTGTCKWMPGKNGGTTGVFAQVRAYAPNGVSLGHGSSLLALNSQSNNIERQPGKVAEKQTGPLTLSYLEQPPEPIAQALTGAYPEQQAKLGAILRTRQVAPITPNPRLLAISYENQVVGYLDEQVTVANNQGLPGFIGVQLFNLLDAEGTELAAYGFGIDPQNPLNYKQFVL